MAYKLIFKQRSLDDLDKLDLPVAQRIVKKISWFARQKDLIAYASKLTDERIGQYRFRIGDYRVIFDCFNKTVFILRIGHRKNIYQ